MTKARKTAVGFRTQRSYICEESVESHIWDANKMGIFLSLDGRRSDRATWATLLRAGGGWSIRQEALGEPTCNQIHECGTRTRSDELGRDNVVAEQRWKELGSSLLDTVCDCVEKVRNHTAPGTWRSAKCNTSEQGGPAENIHRPYFRLQIVRGHLRRPVPRSSTLNRYNPSACYNLHERQL